jgi:hypothetical protein
MWYEPAMEINEGHNSTYNVLFTLIQEIQSNAETMHAT